MNESEKTTKGLGNAGEPKLGGKRPYHKPEVRFERVFEVRALTCGKAQPTSSACAHNKKSS
jgi:hypothetical protein